MKKKSHRANKIFSLIALVTVLLVFLGLAFESNAQVGPGGVNTGIVTWVDASDIDADGLTNDQPADGSIVSTWYDKSGNGKNATTLTGQQSPTLESDVVSLLEGNPALFFPGNAVFVFTGIDLRAVTMPNATIFTVYRHTAGAGTYTGLWGVDNGAWDRFVYTRFGSTTNGIAAQGPVSPVYADIIGSGTQDKIQLFTATYVYNVAGASAFYLGGQLVGTFHDRADPSAAQTNFRLGWDGDDGRFYGQIAELIVYDRKLTDCEILAVNKYLSAKYKQDFNTLSNNYNWPSPSNNDIGVIGMEADICGNTAYNLASSSIATLSNPTSNDVVNEFLSVGHNSGAIASSTAEIPSAHKRRTAREWRVDEDGDLGNVDLCFDVTSVGFLATQANAFSLLIDADGDFTNATVGATGSLSGNTICFSGINFVHGTYFTIAEKNFAPAIITASVNVVGIVEDVLSASNTGTLVSDLLTGASSDGNSDAVGIAIVSRNVSNGIWEFFEAGTWYSFDRYAVPSETEALVLPPAAKVRFVPAPNYNGSASFTYRAWDQTSGTVYLTTNIATNGGATAFSSAIGTASVAVSPVNDAPVITSTALTSINEDAVYSYTVTATDIDAGNTLTYSAPVLPAWLTINGTTGILTGTPINTHVGVHNVTVRINDGTVNVDQVFTITVANTNDAPTISSTAITSVNEDAAYSYTIVASDVDAGNVLTYSAFVLPSWLTFNATTRILSGTPTNTQVGAHDVTLRVNDGTVNTDQVFIITVANTNDAPTISSTAVTSVNEDVAYSYTFIASDVDAGAVLTYSAPVLPSWLTFNTTTGIVSGTPTNSEVAIHNITLRVNDGTVNTDQAFTLTVANTNDAPIINSIAVLSVNEDVAYSYTITASDVDAGAILVYTAPVLPSWLAFNATTKLLSGTPSNSQVGTHNVTLRVTDGTVDVDQTFIVTVANINDAPTISSTAVISVNEDALYSYTIVSTDVDAGDVPTYSATVLPSWLTFNTTTQVLTGTPTNAEVGTHNVTLRVNDGTVNVDQAFIITVANTNDAPTVTSTAVTSINEDAAYSYTIAASDVDAGNVLTYSAPVLPVWLTFNITTHLLAGTPINSQVGTHNVTLRINDGTVNVDQAFVITVANTNDAPTVTSTAVIVGSEDAAYSYTIAASDVDAGAVLTYSAPVLPAWLSFNPTTKVLSGTPVNNEVGTNNVTLRVTDGIVNADQVFVITVANTNDAPTISSTAVASVNEDALYSYTLVAADVDAGNVLTYSTPILPTWLAFNTTTHILSGTPTNNEVGTHNVTLRVNDGTVNVDQVFVVTVGNTNDAPAISSSAVTSVSEDAAYSYTLIASDVDAGNVLTYSAPVLPLWMTFNATTGILSGAPTNNEVGSHNVTLRVNDGTINVDQVFSITVANTNDDPTVTSAAITSVNEDAAYSYTVTAADVDAGNVLAFSAPVLPLWLTFNTTTKVLSGTPTNSEVGVHNVTLRVNDGTVSTDQAFTITVVNTNDAPTISSTAITSVNEDAAYSYTITATDVDAGALLTYSLPVGPAWLAFNTMTRVLSGTPTNALVGSHAVTLRVTDGIVNTDQVFTITVTNTNDIPVINSSPVTSLNEDADYLYTITASDIDASDVLTFSASVLPSWLTFSTTTGVLSGTPMNTEVGSHNVTLRVNDGTANVDQVFIITVANMHDAPVISSTPVTAGEEDEAYAYTVVASDVDAGNILSYTAPVLPAWLTFNPTTRLLSGTPTNSDLGIHAVTLRVNDGTVDVDQLFTINIANANDDPLVTSVAVIAGDEDALYSYSFTATDDDASDVLAYAAPVLPAWLTFNETTGLLSGTPTNDEVGAHAVKLRVSDGLVDVDQVFTITVSNTNDAPSISTTAVTSADEDALFTYNIAAIDVDVNDVLTSSAPVLPAWLIFNPSTGLLTGTPTNDDLGIHNVTLRVNDGTVDEDQLFTITVANINDAPAINSTAVTSVDEDAEYTYTLVASDVDASDALVFSAPVLPTWLTFNPSTGLLSGTPLNEVVGTHNVTLRVTDGTLDIDQVFTIVVANVNDAPVINSIPVTTGEEDALYSYTFASSDADANDVLTYSAQAIPAWLTFDVTTGVLSGTPTNDELGVHQVTLRVNDGTVDVDQTFTITIGNANDEPTITSIAITSIEEGEVYAYTITTTDIDAADVLIYSAPNLPSWLTFNPATGILSGTSTNDEVGTHNVTLRVSDGTSSVDQSFTITVTNINDAPAISSTAIMTAKENFNYSYTITATDVDIDSELTYAAASLPTWLTFNAATGVLEGTPTSAEAGIHLITLTVSDGITSVDQVFTITVAPNLAPIIQADQNFSVDEKSGDGTELGQVLATDADGNTFITWTIVEGNTENAFSIDASTGLITVTNETVLDFDTHSSFTLMVTVSDGFTTSLPAAVTINVIDIMEGLQFYSAFSPNGDGANETWEVDGLEAYPTSHLKIFNSDGMVMFSNVGYTATWDGSYHGKEMPLGTYYYIINLNDGTGKTLNGHLMIIK